MALEDKALRINVQREINKLCAGLDITFMTVMVVNQVVYLGGRVRPERGAAGRNINVKQEMRKLVDKLEEMRGVSAVVCDATTEERA